MHAIAYMFLDKSKFHYYSNKMSLIAGFGVHAETQKSNHTLTPTKFAQIGPQWSRGG